MNTYNVRLSYRHFFLGVHVHCNDVIQVQALNPDLAQVKVINALTGLFGGVDSIKTEIV